MGLTDKLCFIYLTSPQVVPGQPLGISPVGQPIVTTIHSINCINQDQAGHGCGQLAILAMGYDYGKLLAMAAVWGLQEVTTIPYYTGDP